MNYNIVIAGVGGQGVLTICDFIAEAATRNNISVSYYPTKGMAQRGGFVKAQVRLGQQPIGPNISEKSSDLLISMELSETLRIIRFVKPKGEALIYGHIWAPTAVMLGKADYPSLEQVQDQIERAHARLHYLDPLKLPLFDNKPVPPNIYLLGAAMGHTELGKLLDANEILEMIRNRWKGSEESNAFAYQSGMKALKI